MSNQRLQADCILVTVGLTAAGFPEGEGGVHNMFRSNDYVSGRQTALERQDLSCTHELETLPVMLCYC